ncbi:VOC family protein [Amycolatopsis roodepoortensis]|uniref:VOC family protein n=1 Tax=Amycolatopsis roodepoortensis TaxID=700274 RepID=UPI00214C7576|nr:VOC family protein [Amycolatopsis roodepoortensis]UUV29044.1 VOC family protein [Amycolatopsis roodepoortensis]
MTLHRLGSVTIGVPNLAETSTYYDDFGLAREEDGWYSTVDGGRQLRLVPSRFRRLAGMTVSVDDEDDLGRAEANLERIGAAHRRVPGGLVGTDPATGTEVTLKIEPRIRQTAGAPTPYNANGRIERPGTRAPGVLRDDRVRPKRLGHVVLGSTDFAISQKFFVEGIGFKVSDLIRNAGAFLRCTTEHHNLLLLRSPVTYLHHTGWQVDDVDEVGRGATSMLEDHPERHVWGLGRHHVGSNFFWYLKDPAGNFSEYYSDTDCILDDELWKPEVFEGALSFFSWGTPPPPSFLAPEDLAALMMGAEDA